MQFVNNWSRPIQLGASDDSASLELPDGVYRLTITDQDQTAHEIVGAVVDGGHAELERGLEGTTPQNWPSGSYIYCSLTAETVGGLVALEGDGPPAVAPLRPGQVYYDRWESATWISVGAGLAEHWQLFSLDSMSGKQSVYSSQSGGMLLVEPTTRRVEVMATVDYEPSSATVQLPEWAATPAGFAIDVLPAGEQELTLHIDLSALFPTDAAEAYGDDHESGVAMSRDGLELTFKSASAFRVRVVRLYPADAEFDGSIELSVERLAGRVDFDFSQE